MFLLRFFSPSFDEPPVERGLIGSFLAVLGFAMFMAIVGLTTHAITFAILRDCADGINVGDAVAGGIWTAILLFGWWFMAEFSIWCYRWATWRLERTTANQHGRAA